MVYYFSRLVNAAGANATKVLDTVSDDDSSYGYTPTKHVCYIFVCLFTISTLLHICQAIWFKRWFLLFTAVLCGIGEITGWAGRLWSSYNVLAGDAFMMQITCTIISPTFLVAAYFTIFAGIVRHLGTQYSRLSPRLYTIIFCGADVISLVVQGAGGGIASSADDKKGSDLGANIMLGGILFQLVSIIIYSVCAAEFFIRYMLKHPISGRTPPTAPHKFVQLNASSESLITRKRHRNLARSKILRRVKIMCGALVFSTVVILIRSVYRTIELMNGWDGPVITTEIYFNVFDGAMIVLAIYTLNFIHPGYFLP